MSWPISITTSAFARRYRRKLRNISDLPVIDRDSNRHSRTQVCTATFACSVVENSFRAASLQSEYRTRDLSNRLLLITSENHTETIFRSARFRSHGYNHATCVSRDSTEWCVLRLQIGEPASGYGGQLRTCKATFSGDQQYKYRNTTQRFEDCFCLHHQGRCDE